LSGLPGADALGFEPRLAIAALAALGVGLLVTAAFRRRLRRRMQARVRLLTADWPAPETIARATPSVHLHRLAARLGARLGDRLPDQVGALQARLDRAGLAGKVPTLEVMGWKLVCVVCGVAVGLWGLAHYGSGGLLILAAGVLIGWFGIDGMLAQQHARRRRQILRDLPTVMDLLVLSLEAGMSLDRALRIVVQEYRSALSSEIRRVLNDVDLGITRGEAFDRLAARVGLEDLRTISRAIVQSEELGVSLVTVMQTQAREVRISRRRAAEAEALRAPVKMLIPLVIFILPTLFMLLLGPVGLRAGAALSGNLP
jgi:tight adherence protein C